MIKPRIIAPRRARPGMTLVEVIVALVILGSVMLGLGMFSVKLAQSTSKARVKSTAIQLANDRIETVKGSPRYVAIESLYVATETNIPGYPLYTRQTIAQRIGGGVSDTTDYQVVTVQVTHPDLPTAVRKTTAIAPY